METIVTVEALRKRAKELGIKNVKKYKKEELLELVNQAEQKRIEEIKAKEAALKEKSKKRTKEPLEAPKGEQSKQILQMFKDHPNWSHYKICKILNCSYTNVHRIWKIWGEGKLEDKRNFKKNEKKVD